jgi:hypothetical protein
MRTCNLDNMTFSSTLFLGYDYEVQMKIMNFPGQEFSTEYELIA